MRCGAIYQGTTSAGQGLIDGPKYAGIPYLKRSLDM
jgi:hypothetical protein